MRSAGVQNWRPHCYDSVLRPSTTCAPLLNLQRACLAHVRISSSSRTLLRADAGVIVELRGVEDGSIEYFVHYDHCAPPACMSAALRRAFSVPALCTPARYGSPASALPHGTCLHIGCDNAAKSFGTTYCCWLCVGDKRTDEWVRHERVQPFSDELASQCALKRPSGCAITRFPTHML